MATRFSMLRLAALGQRFKTLMSALPLIALPGTSPRKNGEKEAGRDADAPLSPLAG
jgi:hypothetical protein